MMTEIWVNYPFMVIQLVINMIFSLESNRQVILIRVGSKFCMKVDFEGPRIMVTSVSEEKK